MDSDNGHGIDEHALEFLRLLHDMIPWREVPDDVRRDKWRVLAKRLMASSGEDLQEFLHNVIRAVAGNTFYVKRNVGKDNERMLGKELEDYLDKVYDKDTQKKLIAYIKARAIPLVIRLSAILPEGEEEEGGE